MWQVLKDINDLIKEEPHRHEADLEWLKRSMEKRRKAESYRNTIYNYLRKYHKWIGMLSREDIVIMTEWMNAIDKTIFLDQVKYCLETTWGKPMKWIVQNNKSILFSK